MRSGEIRGNLCHHRDESDADEIKWLEKDDEVRRFLGN